MLELYYNFFSTIFSNTRKYENMEVNADSVYLALAEKELHDCMRSEKKQEWEMLWL